MYRFFVQGVVQGVGFRPFIHKACTRVGLKGYVQNTGDGVFIVVDDKDKLLEIFQHLPPLARIDSYSVEEVAETYPDFSIRPSSGEGFSEIPPDLFLCEECLKELRDHSDYRHNYFFITCTNCGPRFSTTFSSPYDRKHTSLQEFPLCSHCQAEFEDPSSRRYHAQTIACSHCGPQLTLSLVEASKALLREEVISVKGVSGFHLVCLPTPLAVSRLRELTGRPNKPYALMCRDLFQAKNFVHISSAEERLLSSERRPIVILQKKEPVLADVSELDSLGIMLPYTGLHYLLFDHVSGPLVMTSSNLPDEPISIDSSSQVVSTVLSHTRKIVNPLDDSLLKVVSGQPLFLRRSRGYVPESLSVPLSSSQTILALGAEMSSTFSIYHNGKIISSQYLGTLSNPDSFSRYTETIKTFLLFTHSTPDVLVCDLHPQYRSTQYAEQLSQEWGIPLVRVQHHRAHAYSVALEHGLDDFVAVVCDGTGFGEDGSLWGGEIFLNDIRVGHLEPQVQLGGDSAALHPGKMLFSLLRTFLSFEESTHYVSSFFSASDLSLMDTQLRESFNCPTTTSCGRILDAASCLLGLCSERTYEGRPALLLEANSTEPYPLEPVIEGTMLLTTPLFEFLVENLDKDKARLAATVQEYLAAGLFRIASSFGKPIVFSGGCAYNRLFTTYFLERGAKVNTSVPCGDGGISYGQIAYHLTNSRDNIS